MHPAAVATPAPVQVFTPAGVATAGAAAGSGSTGQGAPDAVPSPTPFVPLTIAPVTPLAGSNQTPGPLPTPVPAGGAAGGAPGAGAGVGPASAASSASVQSHGPSAGIVVLLALGLVAIAALILYGARLVYRGDEEIRQGKQIPRA